MRGIVATPQFQRDLKRIPLEVIEAFNCVLPRLRAMPTDQALNIRKLVNVHPPVWRVRIGSFRLLYRFDSNTVFLLALRHRKDVYR